MKTADRLREIEELLKKITPGDTAPSYVVGFCFNANHTQVALIRKKRPEWQAGLLNGIGGHIEDGETPIEAQVREFLEETFAATKPEKWEEVCVMYRGGEQGFKCHVLRYTASAIDLNKWLRTATDEQVVICGTKELIFDCVSNLNWLIEMCLDFNPGDFENYYTDCTIGTGGKIASAPANIRFLLGLVKELESGRKSIQLAVALWLRAPDEQRAIVAKQLYENITDGKVPPEQDAIWYSKKEYERSEAKARWLAEQNDCWSRHTKPPDDVPCMTGPYEKEDCINCRLDKAAEETDGK